MNASRSDLSGIDEQSAWKILRRYVGDCLEIDAGSLRAVYAVGSLPAGYYRPGESDIDAVLIVEDGSEGIWGSCVQPSQALADLNQHYLERYQIPKDFGPFPIQQWELFPPYDPEKELVPEIARLKLQGKCVYGNWELDDVPMPTAEDYLQHAQHFEAWWRDEFSKDTPLEAMSTAACVNTILMYLRRFLCIRRDLIVFDKRKLVPAYLKNDPPFVDHDMLRLVEQSLAAQCLSPFESERLREHSGRLRLEMNACLGIKV